jgi:hypothetical protein
VLVKEALYHSDTAVYPLGPPRVKRDSFQGVGNTIREGERK